jgi:hypothetical protein
VGAVNLTNAPPDLLSAQLSVPPAAGVSRYVSPHLLLYHMYTYCYPTAACNNSLPRRNVYLSINHAQPTPHHF